MQTLLSKSQFAKLAGVNPATITRVAPKWFPDAFEGKRINVEHPQVVAYLEMRKEKEVSAPSPVYSEPEPVVISQSAPGEKRYTVIAKQYAEDVLSGEIPACKWVKLACKSFFDDLKNTESPYYYDNKSAAKACKFIELQYHTKGKWAAQKKRLVMEPWQIFFVCNVFGWKKRADGYRRYTEALLFVPRKNGKSQLAAAIGLYLLCADGEEGAEVYCGATNEKQANEVFEPAQIMVRKNEDLRSFFGVESFASSIVISGNGSKFQRLIGNPGDGGSPNGAIVDEYHEHKTDALFATMETGTMAREQPLILVTTTAGDNLAGPCYAMILEAKKGFEDKALANETTFALLYGIDEGDDWASLYALKKANPNYGVSVQKHVVDAKLKNATNNARKQSDYKTKHLNIWVGSREAYFNVERWSSAGDSSIKIEDYYGKRAYIGLDLASKVDIAALELLIPTGEDKFVRFGKYYLPEAALETTASEHYATWAQEGRLTLTDGEIIDFNEIKYDILDLCSKFEIAELAYDPFQATMLVTELMAEGVPVVEMKPTVLNFSEPMKQLDGLIRQKAVVHDCDPVMTWMISNVVAKSDAKDNVYPRKERDENKIDGVVALIMALGRYMNDNAASLDSFLNNPISVSF